MSFLVWTFKAGKVFPGVETTKVVVSRRQGTISFTGVYLGCEGVKCYYSYIKLDQADPPYVDGNTVYQAFPSPYELPNNHTIYFLKNTPTTLNEEGVLLFVDTQGENSPNQNGYWCVSPSPEYVKNRLLGEGRVKRKGPEQSRYKQAFLLMMRGDTVKANIEGDPEKAYLISLPEIGLEPIVQVVKP